MAYAINQWTGNGATKQFSISFPYLQASHVLWYVNGVAQVENTHYTWVNSTTVEFVTAPGNGVLVKAQRSSNPAARLQDWQDGSTLTEQDLDNDSRQNFYLAQEAADLIEDFIATAALEGVSPTAASISNVPSVGLSATNVQGALNEHQSDIDALDARLDTAEADIVTLEADTLSLRGGLDVSFGLRNKIINGDMNADQRYIGNGVTLSGTNTYFVVDRWGVRTESTASGTITARRVQTGVSGDPLSSLRITRSAGTYANSVHAIQVLDYFASRQLAGKTVTVTFRARKGSSYTGNTIRTRVLYGTGVNEGMAAMLSGAWTGTATAADSGAVALTTSYQTFTLQASIPSSAKEVALWFETGLFAGSGSANDYLEITEVQLYEGTEVLPFERRPFELELALCRHFYRKSYPLAIAPGTAAATDGCAQWRESTSGSSTSYGMCVQFDQMRASPTVVLYSPVTGASAAVRSVSAAADITSCTAVDVGDKGFGRISRSVGTFTDAHAYQLHWTADAELS